MSYDENDITGLEVAVIGLSCRFPGASNIEQFWHNLQNGVESITSFTDEQLREQGISEELLKNKDYVKKGSILEQFDLFDERFFGYSPKDAQVLDPQVRLFHECSWEALEDAGYVPDNYPGLIGLFTGASSNLNWNARVLLYEGEHRDQYTELQMSNKDFLATRISYKLNLKGPSLNISTACSTSLVAIHNACRSLLSGECDMAMAGGVSLLIPNKTGYLYQDGAFLSKDGHTRTFDEESNGFIFGSGLGVVVLKPLENALADKDNIYAVIKGSAINNDGNRKVGYMAPSVEGQSEVLNYALQISELAPESISYIETHGSGTLLGDSVEFNAINRVFGKNRTNNCILGSVKTNFGHLDAASGVAGFIKTVLSLQHKQLPPTLHFNKSNPNLDIENKSFEINTTLIDWKNNSYPLRAGVSAFGVGGTNAHVILEAHPKLSSSTLTEKKQLILLSAKTFTSLDKMSENLVRYLKENPEQVLSDIAYTLQAGRKLFDYRKKIVCDDHGQLIDALTNSETRQAHTFYAQDRYEQVVFVFPGQGAQYVNMGRELYENESIFQNHIDQILEILKEFSNKNFRKMLFPDNQDLEWAHEALTCIENNVIVLFIICYALAQLLIAWGIKPDVVIGYSGGEYVAATIAGLFSLEGVLQLLVKRTELLGRLPDGVMLNIPLPVAEVEALLDSSLEIAIDNEDSCVVGGAIEDVQKLEEKLKSKRCICTPLSSSKVIHTSRVNSILDEYRESFAEIKYSKLTIPYLSSVRGDWVDQDEIATADYWIDQLKNCVNFVNALKKFDNNKNNVFIEIGPGHDMSALIKRMKKPGKKDMIVNLIPFSNNHADPLYHFYNRIGSLWQYGITINWSLFNPQCRRISLPTYHFERKRFWLDVDFMQPTSKHSEKMNIRNKCSDWYYEPTWKRKSIYRGKTDNCDKIKNCLVFSDFSSLSQRFLAELDQYKNNIIVVSKGTEYKEVKSRFFTINPSVDTDYEKLFKRLSELAFIPDEIFHFWNINAQTYNPDVEFSGEEQAEYLDNGYFSLINCARELENNFANHQVDIVIIADDICKVTGKDHIIPYKATLLGPLKVIPIENAALSCRCLDIGINHDKKTEEEIIRILLSASRELPNASPVAFRDNYLWVGLYESVYHEKIDNNVLKTGGTYLITGGLGGLGLSIAQYLAQEYRVTLVLVGRSDFPPRQQWEKLLDEKSTNGEIRRKIEKLLEIESSGSTIHLYQADIGDENQVLLLHDEIIKNVGKINGLIHAAGIADGFIIQRIERENSKKMLAAKISGTIILNRIFRNDIHDFCMLFSSLGSLIPAIGQTGYCAANSFLDAYAHYSFANDWSYRVISVNWERWGDLGMSIENARVHKKLTRQTLQNVISEKEGWDAFSQLMNTHEPQIIISAYDINKLVDSVTTVQHLSLSQPGIDEFEQDKLAKIYKRPDLTTEYVAPVNKNEKIIATIWEKQFGIKHVGIYDNLFELGGDSLVALSIQAKIRDEFDTYIPMAYFFNNPTISGINIFLQTKTKNKNKIVIPVELKKYYNLTSVQKRIFFLQKLSPDSTVYNIPSIYQLDEIPDIKHMNETFENIVKRHSTLRASFVFFDNQVMQTFQEKVNFEIQLLESIGNDDTKVLTDFIRPFDLEKAPLLRIGYIKEKNILVIDMHHLIFDEHSQRLLIEDFIQYSEGKTLPELVLQYQDYAEWQNAIKNTELYIEQKKYWLEQFSNLAELPVLNLPTTFKRPKLQSFEGDFVYSEIDRDIFFDFKNMLKQEGVTLNIGLLAIYALFLARICQQKHIVIGTPVSGRKQSELEKVIGVFVDTIALHITVDMELTFSQFLQIIKQKISISFDNQDYPFDELIKNLGIERDLSRNPLFDTMFSFRERYDKSIDLGGIKDITSQYKNKTSMFDLRITAWEETDRIGYEYEYCSKLFDKNAIRCFAKCMNVLLRNATKNSEIRLADIEIIQETEKKRIIYDFNQTGRELSPDETVITAFERQVKHNPEASAVICNVQSIPYGDLNKLANQLAHYLQNKGVKSGTPVGIYLDRSLDMVVALLAVLKAGACYIPIDLQLPRQRMESIVKEVRLKVLITQTEALDDSDYNFENIIYLDSEWNKIKQQNSNNLEIKIEPAQPAYIIFTSGSTGRPKGVIISHRSLINFLLSMTDKPGITKEDSLLSVTTISFDIFGLELYLPLINGAEVIIASKSETQNPASIIELIEQYGISIMQATPSMWRMLIIAGWNGRGNLRILCGGEALLPDLGQELLVRGSSLWNMYGPTETTIWSAITEVKDSNCITIGKPIANTQLYILDSSKSPVPIGVYGELYIGGEGLANGYLNNQDLTSKKFIPHPFSKGKTDLMYQTGDIARFQHDGSVEFAGRNDEQVKVRGFRIEIEEIELVISTYPTIKGNVVLLEMKQFQTPHCSTYEDVLLVCYLVAEKSIKINQLQKYLFEKLPDYMVPQKFHIIDKIPLNTSGKIDRKKLPLLKEERPVVCKELIEPVSETQISIYKIWKIILQLEKISILDSFFDLGGTSITIVLMMEYLNKTFPVALTIADLFSYPTIEKLSKYIDWNLKRVDSIVNLNGVTFPQRFFLDPKDKREDMLLKLQLDENSSNILLSLTQEYKMQVSEVILTLLFYLLHHLAKQDFIEIYILKDNSDVIALSIDFSSIKDFDNLFKVIKKKLNNDLSPITYPLQYIKKERKFNKKLFLVYPLTQISSSKLLNYFNIIWQWEVNDRKIISRMEYDSNLFNPYELKKIPKGFMRLVNSFITNADDK